MAARKPQLQIFMTTRDEAALSERIRMLRPQVVFIDPSTWSSSAIPVARGSIDACAAPFVLMLDESVLTLAEYGRRFFRPHPSGVGYSGATGGLGIVMMGRCREPAYAPGSLGSGRVAAGFESDDDGTEAFAKAVMNVVKKGGRKVHFLDPATGAVLDKPMPGYWAWPDAAQVYDGRDGRYLRPDAINRMVAG
ncbi:hypothetical protein WKW80_16785 [Variovorax humicola]|uniref:Uncharacterized protein n=1 Tax=Variovorax humicola TaxID=1769758 RepID=A0ABU8W353_9BURK